MSCVMMSNLRCGESSLSLTCHPGERDGEELLFRGEMQGARGVTVSMRGKLLLLQRVRLGSRFSSLWQDRAQFGVHVGGNAVAVLGEKRSS